MSGKIKTLLGLGTVEMVGLDIGSSSVKAVRLEKDNDRYRVTGAAMNTIEAQSNDAAAVRQSTVNAINNCFREMSSPTRYAVCGVCGPEVSVRGFSFPNIPSEAVEQAVILEAKQVCPLDINSSVVDYQVINCAGDDEQQQTGTKGILVMATNELIDAKKNLAGSAAVKNVYMDVEGLAVLNCAAGCEASKNLDCFAVLNVGKSFTNVIIQGQGGLPFIRDLPDASSLIIRQIAKETNLSEHDVEQALRDKQTDDQIKEKLSVSLRSSCENLINDISETLRYYSLQNPSTMIEKIFVCGGFALVTDFVEMLRSRFVQEVVVLNPFEKMEVKGSNVSEEFLAANGPALTVAAGLAMRTVKYVRN